MNCYTSAIVGIGMLAATYSTMSVSEEHNNFLRKIYGNELTDKYNSIVIERRNIYFQGLVLGIVISYFVLKLIRTANVFHRITFTLAIVIPISVIYYLLMPKSDYMLKHLKTQEQNEAWLKVYKNMKTRYLLGFIFGSLSAIPIAYAFC